MYYLKILSIHFNMEMSKNEKNFRNVFSNLIIFGLIFIVFAGCFFASIQEKTILTSNSEYRGTIYAGDKTSGKVSLMVNVCWGNEYLEKMLDVLKKYNLQTTFFIGGSWAVENQELLKRIKNEGHEIANHGYSHKDHSKLGYNENMVEIQKCHSVIKEILNLEMELFAPPSGAYNDSTIKVAEELGYKTIMWTRDTIDWRDKNPDLIYSRAVSNLSSGDLILMHPTDATAEVFEKIILEAKNKNLKVSTVKETLGF